MSSILTQHKYTPDKDGVDHINVMSRSRTTLGKQLSNFALSPFKHPKYGEFASIEAFYYWLSTGRRHEHLRSLYGIHAKKAGKELERVYCENFQKEIIEAICIKIKQNPALARALANNNLPLAHYYWFGTIHNCKIYNVPEHDYMIQALEELKDKLIKENFN